MRCLHEVEVRMGVVEVDLPNGGHGASKGFVPALARNGIGVHFFERQGEHRLLDFVN